MASSVWKMRKKGSMMSMSTIKLQEQEMAVHWRELQTWCRCPSLELGAWEPGPISLSRLCTACRIRREGWGTERHPADPAAELPSWKRRRCEILSAPWDISIFLSNSDIWRHTCSGRASFYLIAMCIYACDFCTGPYVATKYYCIKIRAMIIRPENFNGS